MESTRPEPRKYRLADRFVVRRVGGKVFVLDGEGRMHTLDNATAIEVWDRLEAAGEAGVTPAEVGAALAAAFEVDAQTAAADAGVFLEHLVGLGLASLPPRGAD